MKKLLFILLAGVALTVAGCSSAPAADLAATNTPTAEAEKDDSVPQELIVVGQEIAASLDPVQPLSSSYLRGIGAAEALFKVNADGEVVPELAESAAQTDATTWEIKLRADAVYWSGKSIDAAAVIASLERSRSLDLQALPFLEELSFTAVDDYTVQVKTKRSNVSVPLNLSYYQTVIHNAEAVQEKVETMDLTGMYKVTEFVPKQKLVLSLNDSYWGQKPAIPTVVYEEIADEQTRVLSVLSGRSHVALNIPVTSTAQFKDDKAVSLSATPAANTQTIYLNLKRPQLADARVRQALSWSLNREELVILAAEGQSTPVTTWLSSNPAYSEAKQAVYSEFNPDKAEQLLDEAGWKKDEDGFRYKDGEALTLRLRTWGGDKALGEALQNQWSAIGINAEVEHGDYSLIQTARDSGDWDASIEAWSTFGDELTLLTGQYAPEGSANYGGYNDAETNQWLSELAEASDQAARQELALRINERVAEQAPVISLFPRPQLTAVSQSLSGFQDHFRQFENVVHANLSLDPK